ncbi:DUF535 family protein [Polynucleobacter sp. es-MAR-4]|uniref:DUF535 family protein n=1 Tax=Polynucleobacter sp. es-MAR-4 TaxID=1855655 RepID=UPI001C0D4604|nr:DUF535 family protein [Polynucleobacter sp. es-MAR-4]MBU3636066.1 DUF535 family protein [Polynucleobacter sp. es-MAR-4]
MDKSIFLGHSMPIPVNMPFRASQRTALKILAKPHLVMRARRCLQAESLQSIKNNYKFHYLRITKRNINFINGSMNLREKIYSFHYTILSKIFNKGFVDLICHEGAVLWRSYANPELAIYLKQGHKEFRDGEIELQFKHASKVIYCMGFTLVPKNVLHAGSDSGVLITRVQGSTGYLDFLKSIKNDIADVGVNHLLFAAMRGLSAYMGFQSIFGVRAKFQSYYIPSRFDRFNNTYDNFWQALQATKVSGAFYRLPTPYIDKDISKISQRHRSRVRKKRQLKMPLLI